MRRRPLPPPRAPRWHVCHTSPRVITLSIAIFAVVYAVAPGGVDGEGGTVVAWLLDDDIGDHWVEVYVTTGSEHQLDGAEIPLERVVAFVGDEEVNLTHRSWGSWATSHTVPPGSDVWFEGVLEGGGIVRSPHFRWPG